MEKILYEVNDLFVCFDLEMNQPSDKIIQIGAVIGNIRTGQIIETFDRLVSIDEPLCVDPKICDIVKLTGITDQDLKNHGVPLIKAYKELIYILDKYKVQKMPMVWGIGDVNTLRTQVLQQEKMKFYFNRRFIDIKSLYQMYMHINNESMPAGLKKACNKLGIKFTGDAHNASVDALNTFKVAHFLLQKLIIKEGVKYDK